MINVLLVGDHPEGYSGNSHMITTLIDNINKERFNISVLAINPRTIVLDDMFKNPSYPIIDASNIHEPEMWKNNLVAMMHKQKVDIIMFVGLDIWVYAPILPQLQELRKIKRFVSIGLFPYDQMFLREDWVKWINMLQIPCVYSEFGYNLLKEKVPNITYFRPPLYDAGKFIEYNSSEKMRTREKLFKGVIKEDDFIFGFVGNNQIRKDPQRLIKAFFDLKKEIPNVWLYLHTDMIQNAFCPYNISRYLKDCGMNPAEPCVFIKKQFYAYTTAGMVDVYNTMNCLVLPSLQEGLSWTIIEAMLCGVPVIASNSTAHIELLKDGAGIPIEMTELAYNPVVTDSGVSYAESRACDPKQLLSEMKRILKYPLLQLKFRQKGKERAQEWLKGVSDINELLEEAAKATEAPAVEMHKKIQAVLFAQHSSAGDVFMTTRCLKGIKQRYKGLELHYMTQKQYIDILVNNPHIDKLIPWDERNFGEYMFVLNPHGERILPGHWGRNSNSILSDFYWQILMVEPDDFYIEQKPPEEGIIDEIMKERLQSFAKVLPICILHTTGGDPEFRTYKYMADIAKELRGKYLTIQIGMKNDYPAGADIDLRGKLSFREAAWTVSRAEIAVTIDSFVSHLCGALGVSQVCLFSSGNYNVVRPNQIRGALLCMVPNYVLDCPGLGPCSASVRDCPTPCTGLHDPKKILEQIKVLEERIAEEKRKEINET